ncbi:MAG: peptidoglycan-binding protein [Hyphomicrobiales bacterium]|nr:peptidoglycan-binding protein [Hyphomicrobiales bacterium]
MRDRRTSRRRAAARSSGVLATVLPYLYGRIAQRPVDFFTILAALAASVVIIVNAVFLQSYAHPAPFVDAPSKRHSGENPTISVSTLKPAETVAMRPTVPQRAVQAVSARRHDPIADLIGTQVSTPSARVSAVQRVLSSFGYGQMRASGIVDEPTRSAIEKFESEHKMPVTGRVSDRLMAELAAMIGHPVE